jgi:peptidoglycan/xylan/chitin deacetylase (PgdA/CDA1 family)
MIHLAGGVLFMKRSAHLLRILMYHRFSDKPEAGKLSATTFARQIDYLKHNYELITFEHLLQWRQATTTSVKKPYAIITVDDGYFDFYQYAYPILRAFEVPAVLFPVVKFIEDRKWMLHDIIDYALSRTTSGILNLPGTESVHTFDLSRKDQHDLTLNNAIYDLISNAPHDERSVLIDRLCHALAVTIPKQVPDSYAPLTWKHVLEMSKCNIEIGAHSLSHFILTALPPSRAKEEIQKSVNFLKATVGKNIPCFCYPNGKKGDYNQTIMDFVEETGVSCAVTAIYGMNSLSGSPYELRRIGVGENLRYFVQDLTGCGLFLRKWR